MTKRDLIILGIFLALISFQHINNLAIDFKKSTSNNQLGARKEKADYFAGIVLEAKSAIVWDARDNRVIYGKNEHAQLPLASLVKIMTVFVALDAGKIIATIPPQSIRKEGDSGLFSGEEWTLSDLAKLTLVSSANDGASSMAAAWVSFERLRGKEIPFTEAMNERAKTLGLSQTYFLNTTGLDVSSSINGAYGSAENMAKLFYKAVITYPEIFGATGKDRITLTSLANKKRTVINTNGGVEKMTGIVASKTGYTKLAGGNLVIISDVGINHPIVISVLGSSEKERFTDAEKLLSATIEAISDE